MADKNKLAAGLAADQPRPQIRRGAGVTLSTQQVEPAAESQDRIIAEVQQSENAETQKRGNAETQLGPKRVNRGYQLREDLIKDLRRVALNEDRKLYEVMEEAITEYLARKGGAQ